MSRRQLRFLIEQGIAQNISKEDLLHNLIFGGWHYDEISQELDAMHQEGKITDDFWKRVVNVRAFVPRRVQTVEGALGIEPPKPSQSLAALIKKHRVVILTVAGAVLALIIAALLFNFLYLQSPRVVLGRMLKTMAAADSFEYSLVIEASGGDDPFIVLVFGEGPVHATARGIFVAPGGERPNHSIVVDMTGQRESAAWSAASIVRAGMDWFFKLSELSAPPPLGVRAKSVEGRWVVNAPLGRLRTLEAAGPAAFFSALSVAWRTGAENIGAIREEMLGIDTSSKRVKKIGREKENGISLYHVRFVPDKAAVLDFLSRVAADMEYPTEAGLMEHSALAQFLSDSQWDVWVDADDFYPRRVMIESRVASAPIHSIEMTLKQFDAAAPVAVPWDVISFEAFEGNLLR